LRLVGKPQRLIKSQRKTHPQCDEKPDKVRANGNNSLMKTRQRKKPFQPKPFSHKTQKTIDSHATALVMMFWST
jgi:hypothetical protein